MNLGDLNNSLIGSGLVTIVERKKEPSQLSTVKDIQSFIWQSVEMEMAMNDDHEPLVLIIRDSDVILARMGRLFVDEDGKRIASVAIKEMVSRLKLLFVVFVTAAQVAAISASSREEALKKEREIRASGQLKDYPHSIEGIVVAIEKKGEKRAMTQLAKINRKPDGKFLSVERLPEMDGNGLDFDGLFSNMLAGCA